MQNESRGEHLECRVVSVKKAPIGPQVALEFTQPTPSFWHIVFAPADWKPNA